MTDLTILIAVIALALWPLAFLVLRIRHERKKRRNRLDRMTKEDLEDIGTEELVIAVLKKIGCQPETNEEGHIVFKYQGDDFYIAVEDEARFIMIWNPWWASISVDNPALPYLKEIVNLVNVDSLVTTVFTADEDEKNVGLHSKCHTVFTPKEGQLDEYLKAMLDHFFVTHDAIKQNLQQLGSAASESVNKEKAEIYLTQAAEQGNQYAAYLLEHWQEAVRPDVFLMTTRLLRHLGNVFADESERRRSGSGMAVDRKLRRKIREKKIAQGHAEDDHAQIQTM